MIPRLVTTSLSILAVLWLSISIAAAANSMDGKIEKAANGVIELKDDSGTISKYDVDSGAKITLDGKSVKLDELPVGAPATVTTETKNNKTVAVKIIAKSPL
ncbi:MAG TPA: hypothetical protein VGM05_24485 [Planctomycetaceae bacterium]